MGTQIIDLHRKAAVAVLLVGIFFLIPSHGLASRPHDFNEGECSFCHRQGGSKGTWAMQPPEEDISPKCVNCHGSCGSWPSHEDRAGDPSVMREYLPLAEGETMVCITCHRPHAASEREEGAPLALLRIGNLKRELCLNCHRGERREGWRVEVAVPPVKAVVYDEHVPLLGRAENLPGDYLEIRINGVSFPLRVQRGAFHTRLLVQEGLNVLEVVFRGENLWRGEILRAGDGVDTMAYDGIFYAHQTGSLEECFGCHRRRDGLLRADTADIPGICYRCHEPFGGKRYLHGPLAVGDCTTCHDPHGGRGPSHLREREVDLCRSCHGDDEVLGHDGGRQAMTAGSCSQCHDPHQSDTRFFTRRAGL